MKFGVASEWVIYRCCVVENPDMLSRWREARLIFNQSQSSHGMAGVDNVYVQTARMWLLTEWVASEQLILYSVNDGAAREWLHTVYTKKYAHGIVVLCFFVVMQSFIMNSHEVFIHIHQGCFAGTGAIVRLPQCQWSKPDGYGKISQCITTTKHSKAKTVCIFLGIYCMEQVARE